MSLFLSRIVSSHCAWLFFMSSSFFCTLLRLSSKTCCGIYPIKDIRFHEEVKENKTKSFRPIKIKYNILKLNILKITLLLSCFWRLCDGCGIAIDIHWKSTSITCKTKQKVASDVQRTLINFPRVGTVCLPFDALCHQWRFDIFSSFLQENDLLFPQKRGLSHNLPKNSFLIIFLLKNTLWDFGPASSG